MEVSIELLQTQAGGSWDPAMASLGVTFWESEVSIAQRDGHIDDDCSPICESQEREPAAQDQ